MCSSHSNKFSESFIRLNEIRIDLRKFFYIRWNYCRCIFRITGKNFFYFFFTKFLHQFSESQIRPPSKIKFPRNHSNNNYTVFRFPFFRQITKYIKFNRISVFIFAKIKINSTRICFKQFQSFGIHFLFYHHCCSTQANCSEHFIKR